MDRKIQLVSQESLWFDHFKNIGIESILKTKEMALLIRCNLPYETLFYFDKIDRNKLDLSGLKEYQDSYWLQISNDLSKIT